jgi:hypothetical protein
MPTMINTEELEDGMTVYWKLLDLEDISRSFRTRVPIRSKTILERTEWPLTTIKNYPVQGLGADLVMLARIELMRLIEESGLEALLVMTVHDSLVIDTPSRNVEEVSRMILEAVDKVPQLCYTNWSYRFSLPMSAEIKVVEPSKH